MNPDYPVVVGFCGRAGTGKTSVGRAIAPQASLSVPVTLNDKPLYEIVYDHLFLAMPLYELQHIRQGIEGEHRSDRILFETHRALGEILGTNPLFGNTPPYDEFVELVRTISNLPIKAEGKDRAFLQNVGSLCRSYDPDAFVNWVRRKIYESYARVRSETEDNEYICIVSDVRMPNEAAFIAREPNGLLIEFTASEETRDARLYERDGALMTPEQKAHESERVEDIDPSLIDITINTDDMSLEDHIKTVKQIIVERYHYAATES